MHRRRGKYNAPKIRFDNIDFDSQLEYRRYLKLKIMMKAGLIRDLEVHPTYPVVPSNELLDNPSGRKRFRPKYSPDFSYIERITNKDSAMLGKWVLRIEETKGCWTADAITKVMWWKRENPELAACYRVLTAKDI